ncbi:MAG: glycosyltransferase, partial [Prevotella sp.]|nr:glycosyltransferase [Prevotella sp.]
MTIIHYIPTMDPKAGTAPEYVECLVRATRNVAESHVITDSDLGDNVISIRKSIRGFVEKFRPDILHIHAAWSFKAAMVMKKATEMGVFTLLSVHGGLAPEVVDLDFWKQKLPRLICYQLLMVRKCQALVAVSQEDYDSLKALGWKKRIVNIPHPALFHKSDEETKDL